ncbi:MAG: hypothetical protein NTZ83_03135 [Candidatus Pacearchaeota archaeon]|nr:hypothetical protein [Candidatus Pacearchaeota archaeon]
MERGMRVYAKISSIIFSVLLILAIVFILLVRYSNCIGYKMCTSDFVIYGPIHWVIACLVLIVGVIVLIPLFYYGWNKEPKSNRIKILTKIKLGTERMFMVKY